MARLTRPGCCVNAAPPDDGDGQERRSSDRHRPRSGRNSECDFAIWPGPDQERRNAPWWAGWRGVITDHLGVRRSREFHHRLLRVSRRASSAHPRDGFGSLVRAKEGPLALSGVVRCAANDQPTREGFTTTERLGRRAMSPADGSIHQAAKETLDSAGSVWRQTGKTGHWHSLRHHGAPSSRSTSGTKRTLVRQRSRSRC